MPAVSIVIPTYNLENYIGQLLDTILAQTFKDFEVIVVDDYSKDRTPDVVESYRSKFEGRLKFHQLPKNSDDAAATPKMFGLNHARGKYVIFIDGDDLLTANALESFITAAEKFQADLVYTDSFLQFVDRGRIPKNSELTIHHQRKPEDRIKTPTLVDNSPAEKVKKYLGGEVPGFYWNKLIRREFLLDYKIEFSKMPVRHDTLFSLACFVLGRSVRIPQIANAYRQMRKDANSARDGKWDEVRIRRWIRDILIGARDLRNFCQSLGIFLDDPRLEYATITWFLQDELRLAAKRMYASENPIRIEQIIIEEAMKDPVGFIPVFAHLFNMANRV